MQFLTLFNTTDPEPLDLTFFQEIYDELTSPKLWMNIGTSVLISVILLIAGYILTKVVNRLIDNFFKYKSKSRLKGSDKRNNTLINVLQNGATIFIWFFVIVAILESFSIPVATLLAGAGVVGLAIGFGAQSLVTSGTTVAEGEVLSLGLRSSRIQGYEGELYMIPNGTINEVINFSRYNSISYLDMNFSIQEDLDKVEDMINSYFENHWREEEVLVEQPAILGVQDIQHGEATVRIMLTTQPMEHFGATRRTRKRLKQHLESHGVFVSVPTMDISDFDQNDAEE